jgi:hypothetical protein
MYLQAYIEKATIEAYVLGNQTATGKKRMNRLLALHSLLREEKLAAELLLDPGIPAITPPPHAIIPLMAFVRGGQWGVFPLLKTH